MIDRKKLSFLTAAFLFLFVFSSGSVESKIRGQDTLVGVTGLSGSNDTLLVNDDFTYSRKVPAHSREILSHLSDRQEVGLIILYKKGASFEENGIIEKRLGKLGLAKARGTKGDISSLVDDPSVEIIEVDQPMTLATEPAPWNINLTNAPIAWNLTKGNGISIAILDSGIALHPDLLIAGGTSMISDNYTDTYGHGTAVAGIISAIINDQGLIGVAPEADIYPVKITDGPTGMISDALAGLDWAIANNMTIISMSFGFEEYSPAFASAVQEAYTNGALLVAAAGNDNGNITYPAKYDEVIAVGSVDSNLERAPSSNYGPELELMAPGVDINTTWTNSGYEALSGTSLSAPHVAGIAALIKSSNTTLTNSQIRATLQNTAKDLGSVGRDDDYGYGLVQYQSILNLTPPLELQTVYSIYNLTYIDEIESLTFWTNGSGSYQHTNFTQGLYLINITDGVARWIERINVSENGTFTLLANIQITDTFTVDSSSTTDGFGFLNDANLTVKVVSPGNANAYCFDYNNSGNYSVCRYNASNDYNDCINYAGTLSEPKKAFYDLCFGDLDCSQSIGLTQSHSGITTTPIKSGTTSMILYIDCANNHGSRAAYQYFGNYYIIDQRRAICNGDTTYRMQGRAGTPSNYLYYGPSSISCSSPTRCDWSRDDEIYTTNRSTAINPCRYDVGASCTATEQCLNGLNCTSSVCTNLTGQSQLPPRQQCFGNVSVAINPSSLNDLFTSIKILVNGTLNGTPNSAGSYVINYKNVTCGDGFIVTAQCANTTINCTQRTKPAFSSSGFTSTEFDCSVCKFRNDVSVDKDGIKFYETGVSNESNTTIIFTIGSVATTNLEMKLSQHALLTGETLVETLIPLSSKSPNSTANVTVKISSDQSKLRVMLDPGNKIVEESKTNNYAEKNKETRALAFISVHTGNAAVDEAITEFLSEQFTPAAESSSRISIIVGMPRYNTNTSKYNNISFTKHDWGARSDTIWNKGTGYLYSGLIGKLSEPNHTIILIYGNGIEETIAALRVFGNTSKQLTITGPATPDNKPLIIGRNNQDYNIVKAIFSQVSRNEDRNTPNVKELTRRALKKELYDSQIHLVDSGLEGIKLRTRRMTSSMDSNFSRLISNGTPVILARGIFSTLDDWRPLGSELSDLGFETWLIEITGGPEQDNMTSLDYTPRQMTQYFVPALVNGVRNISNKDKVKYVGFSNGCRAALMSMEEGYLDSSKIDTFIGAGCPGNFSSETSFGFLLKETGPTILRAAEERGLTHLGLDRIMALAATHISLFQRDTIKLKLALALATFKLSLDTQSPISRNLFHYYSDISINTTDTNPGNIELNNTLFIHGFRYNLGKADSIFFVSDNSDGVVPLSDMVSICKVVSSPNKLFTTYSGAHFAIYGDSLPDNRNSKDRVKEFLLTSNLTSTDNVIRSSTCEEETQ